MPVETSRVPALKNLATRLRIESIRATTEAGSGHPTTCMSAADLVAALFFGEMRYDPAHPQHRTRRPLRAVEGPRRAAALRGLVRGRLRPPRRPADAAAVHLRPRGPPDAAAAVRRRRHRVARPGPVRRHRHRPQRAPDRLRLPHLRADGRRRDRPKGRCGRRPPRRQYFGLDNLVGITDVNALGQSRATQFAHDLGSLRAPLARVRLAHRGHRRPRHGPDPRRRWPRRGRPGARRR